MNELNEVMKSLFSLTAAVVLLNSGVCLPAQDARRTTDAVVDPPPVETPAPLPGSSKSSSKRKITSQTNRRATLIPEAKVFTYNSRERGSKPLIVRSGHDAKATTQLQEDLAVMSRILEKAALELREEREEAAGIPIVALAGGRNVRAMYLEDYGAVFTMTVGIPLRAESKPEEVEEKVDKVKNEEWNEARNELFGDRRPARGEKGGKVDFDPHQFEEFRDSLLDALRNGANIRNLRNTDWVTVIVRGRGVEEEMERRFDVFLGNGGAGREAVIASAPPGEERGPEPSTMVVRLRKADLDQAAKQPQSRDELKKKASLAFY